MPSRPDLEPLYAEGLAMRREVLGAEYVDASLARANGFNTVLQDLATEMAWGYAWTRPGLDRRTRSFLTLALLTALGRGPELKLHVRGALTNGLTVDEIKETLLHATAYVGVPAGLDAFRAATEALTELGAIPAAAERT